jgi:hypothetical protein
MKKENMDTLSRVKFVSNIKLNVKLRIHIHTMQFSIKYEKL